MGGHFANGDGGNSKDMTPNPWSRRVYLALCWVLLRHAEYEEHRVPESKFEFVPDDPPTPGLTIIIVS